MGRYILIQWKDLGIRVRAKLLDDKAPNLCREFWNILPLESIPWHAVISGENLGFLCPIVWTKMENPVDRAVGDVYLYANGQLIAIPYGKTTEPCKVNKFAEIVKEDLDKLNSAGKAISESFFHGNKKIFKVKVMREG